MLYPLTLTLNEHSKFISPNTITESWSTMLRHASIKPRHYVSSQSQLIKWKLCVYLVSFLRYSQLFVEKSPILTHPTYIWALAPLQGLLPVEFRGDLWNQKTRFHWLSCGVLCVILCLAILVEHRLVTDRRTDRQTPGHSIYRAGIASRGKNCWACKQQWQVTHIFRAQRERKISDT